MATVGPALLGEEPKPIFKDSVFNASLSEWLQAGATVRERENTHKVLSSTLAFTPQVRPRTSSSRPGTAQKSKQQQQQQHRSMSASGQSRKLRPYSTGDFAPTGLGDSTRLLLNASIPGAPKLPPKPNSPNSVLDFGKRVSRPGTASYKTPSAATPAVSAGPLIGGGARGLNVTNTRASNVFSERPCTSRTTEQRFSLRPATAGGTGPQQPALLPQRNGLTRALHKQPGLRTATVGSLACTTHPLANRPSTAQAAGRSVGPFPDRMAPRQESILTSQRLPGTERAGEGADSCPQVLDCTTSSMYYGMREVAPEVYQDLVDICKPIQAENRNFTSQYDLGGDGFPMFYKKTSYGEATEAAAAAISENSAAQEHSFYNWIQCQKYYYADMLTKEAAAEVDAWFETATDEEKAEFVKVFRQMHATIDPEKHKSLSHVHYKAQRNPLTPEDVALINEENKFATYGRPKAIRAVNITVGAQNSPGSSGGQRPGTASSPGMTLPGGAGGTATVSPAEMARLRQELNMKKELYESKVPLKWACTPIGPMKSAYILAHGDNMPDLMHQTNNYATEQAKLRPAGLGPTLGFGKVDPVVYQHKTRAFPVPDCYIYGTLANAVPREDNKNTTYNLSHGTSGIKVSARLSPEEQVAAAKVAAIEAIRMKEFHQRAQRSSIPLGSQAIMNQPNPKTMNQTTLVRYAEDNYKQDETNARLTAVYNGPTGSIGACAPAEGTNLPTMAQVMDRQGKNSWLKDSTTFQ